MNQLTQQAEILERAIASMMPGYDFSPTKNATMRVQAPDGAAWEFTLEPGWEALFTEDDAPVGAGQRRRSLWALTLDRLANVSRLLVGAVQPGRSWA
jgi:hypothetical protein